MVKGVCGTMSWITLRNDVLDLPVSSLNIDFAVSAKPVLDIHQGLNEYRVGGSTCMITESVPIFDLLNFFSKISVETGRGGVQRLNTLHSDFPISFISRRRAQAPRCRGRGNRHLCLRRSGERNRHRDPLLGDCAWAAVRSPTEQWQTGPGRRHRRRT